MVGSLLDFLEGHALTMELGFYMLAFGPSNVDSLFGSCHLPRIIAVKIGKPCSEGAFAYKAHACPKILDLLVDDSSPPLGVTIGSDRGCSGGLLCIDATNATQNEQLARPHVSESWRHGALCDIFCLSPLKFELG